MIETLGTFCSAIRNDDLAALEKLCAYFRWDTTYECVSTDEGLVFISLNLGVVPFMIHPSPNLREWHLVQAGEAYLSGKTVAEVCHKTIAMFPSISKEVLNGRGIQAG